MISGGYFGRRPWARVICDDPKMLPKLMLEVESPEAIREGEQDFVKTRIDGVFQDVWGRGLNMVRQKFLDKRRKRLKSSEFYRVYTTYTANFLGFTYAAGMWFPTNVPSVVDFPSLVSCGGEADEVREELDAMGQLWHLTDVPGETHTLDYDTGEFDSADSKGGGPCRCAMVRVPPPGVPSKPSPTNDGSSPARPTNVPPVLPSIESTATDSSEAESRLGELNGAHRYSEYAKAYYQHLRAGRDEAAARTADEAAKLGIDVADYDSAGWFDPELAQLNALAAMQSHESEAATSASDGPSAPSGPTSSSTPTSYSPGSNTGGTGPSVSISVSVNR